MMEDECISEMLKSGGQTSLESLVSKPECWFQSRTLGLLASASVWSVIAHGFVYMAVFNMILPSSALTCDKNTKIQLTVYQLTLVISQQCT